MAFDTLYVTVSSEMMAESDDTMRKYHQASQQKTHEELVTIEAQLARMDEAIDELKKELTFVEGIEKRFREGTRKEQKEIINRLIHSADLTDGKMALKARLPFSLPEYTEIRKRGVIAPPKTRSESGDSSVENELYQLWRDTVNSFLTKDIEGTPPSVNEELDE